MSEHGLICVLWKDYNGEVPSVRKNCKQCNAEIAVDELNILKVIAEGIVLICMPCGLKIIAENQEPTQFAALVGGRSIESPTEAIKAAIGRIRRRQG